MSKGGRPAKKGGQAASEDELMQPVEEMHEGYVEGPKINYSRFNEEFGEQSSGEFFIHA